ncbi:hypothetical protein JVX93_16025 [Mycolicibacterium boenickei]|nr:hypothetical protein JVX93_16025 [Mycolicibacterium boenickei]
MAFAVVKGEALRVTKTDSCGKPLQGAANRIVTDGFIEFNIDPEMKAREDLETTSASGKVCVSATTPAERKWWNISAQLCGVDPDLWALILAWARVTDYDGKPIGVRDRKSTETDTGVMFELWTGQSDDDGCDIPEDDSIFSTSVGGKQYGYLAIGGREFVTSTIGVSASPTNFTLNGRSYAPKRWGRGPYNVAAIDSSGTAGRLLVPLYNEVDQNHLALFTTPIAPPEPTNGACELAIQSIFTGPSNTYFGATAADVAPAQPICNGKVYTVAVTGTGNWTAAVGTEDTANIAHTALATAVQSAIENLPNVEVGQVQVAGTAGNYTVTLDPSLPALSADGGGLTGGTVTVTPA